MADSFADRINRPRNVSGRLPAVCLVAIAWQTHAEYPLILAGNRDEFHARASAPAAWWEDFPRVFGGRDLVAGGSWLACSRSGRIAVVLNDPRRRPAASHDLSRGKLVQDFVSGTDCAADFLKALAAREHRYAGFQLLVGTVGEGLLSFRSPAGAHEASERVASGGSAYGNSPPDDPWPKETYVAIAFARLVSHSDLQPTDLFNPLARRESVDGSADERTIRATPFVLGPQYGTRASTLLLADRRGTLRFVERGFAADGSLSSEVDVSFAIIA